MEILYDQVQVLVLCGLIISMFPTNHFVKMSSMKYLAVSQKNFSLTITIVESISLAHRWNLVFLYKRSYLLVPMLIINNYLVYLFSS